MVWTRAALALGLTAAGGLAALSGASSTDPRTPPALPGLPPPFTSDAVVGDGGLVAGIDAYGDVADLSSEPAGPPLVDDPLARQRAGTVPGDTGIVPRASFGVGPPLPLWRATAVSQSYVPRSNVLRTVARFPEGDVEIVCAAAGQRLGCLGRALGGARARVFFSTDVSPGAAIALGGAPARRTVAEATTADRRWLSRARPLGGGAPPWAERAYLRSLLVLHALEGPGGGIAAGTRDGWDHVWPRDAAAAAIALAASGYRADARRAARFLSRLDLASAARFGANGEPVAGRAAQGDAAGWVAAAARAAGRPAPSAPPRWRGLADYQEGGPGDYLGNALAAASLRGRGAGSTARFSFRRGLVRAAGDPASGLDSAAAWAVQPFRLRALYPAARRTLLRLAARSGRFGLLPSQGWSGGADPWTAPTAWTAWGLAALGERRPALRLLGELRRAQTPSGLLPERVGARSGVPLSTTPLAWSHAFAILALRELWPGPRPPTARARRRRPRSEGTARRPRRGAPPAGASGGRSG